MPQIDKVTHEFADQGVELFAINLEETPDKVKTALEHLKLTTTVALDNNGRVAEKYGSSGRCVLRVERVWTCRCDLGLGNNPPDHRSRHVHEFVVSHVWGSGV